MPDVIFPFNFDEMKVGEAGNYDAFSAQSVDIIEEGVLQIPISEDESGSTGGDDCIVVKTSKRWGRRVIIWMAVQTGKVPKVPSSVSNDSNAVLLQASYGVSEPKPTADGRFTIAVSGKYEYALLRAPTEETGFKGVKAPYTNSGVQVELSGDSFQPQ